MKTGVIDRQFFDFPGGLLRVDVLRDVKIRTVGCASEGMEFLKRVFRLGGDAIFLNGYPGRNPFVRICSRENSRSYFCELTVVVSIVDLFGFLVPFFGGSRTQFVFAHFFHQGRSAQLQ